MQISYQADGGVLINIKNKGIRLGGDVRIEEYVIPGAGEYDVAAIQCEVHALSGGLAYFFHAEDLTVAYLEALSADVTKLDEASSTDVLIADLRSDATVEQLKPIIKGLEPSYVLLTGAGVTDELITGLGLAPYEASSTLKVTRGSLPLEGTFLVGKA